MMDDNQVKDPGLRELPVDVFSIIERVCSVFSLVGSLLVIVTFCLSKAFHKPINRLVFYASFGNLMTNAATLMARSFIGDSTSAGCQFQAFLIQMFMPADTFWTLAMAINVYLTFYFKFDAQRLRRMEIPYLLACYGIPFIIALTYIFISTDEKGRMYGNATLWCWISPKWDIYRITTFYGPIWIVILITFFIYIRAGREIYKRHRQLRDFSTSHHDNTIDATFPIIEDPFSSVKTTEVSVTSEVIDKNAISLEPMGQEPKQPNPAYSVHISSNRRPADRRESYGEIPIAPTQTNVTIESPTATRSTGANPLRRRALYEANNATWSYTKCAILFFTAMLVTWIPSSANRVYSVVHHGHASLPLEYMSAFVLPLQGFWNAIIYVVTSWQACKLLWEDVRWWGGRSSREPKEIAVGSSRAFQRMSSVRNGSKSSDKTYESESMTELAGGASTQRSSQDPLPTPDVPKKAALGR